MFGQQVLRTLAVATFVAAAGCTATPVAPVVPTGTTIREYASANFSEAVYWGATPRETLVIGIAYVDEKCIAFFDAVERTRQVTVVGQSTFLTTGNQVQAILNLAEASTLAIAGVAGALEITKVFLEQYLHEFVFSPHSSELKAIVNQAMTAQRKEFGQLVESGALTSQVEVVAAVKRYAENCTLATIREHWNRAIARAVDEGVAPESAVTGEADAALIITPRRRAVPTNVLGVNKYVVR
ncbi:hypothetical protein [Mesorhizobium sp.]|uniref:hypothetical protein n=1 Tax=Mesorhizobium sp. TaxID=1871066 RepID=UPI000FE5BC2A|nr:hypothetical protein [Mesorhizobium sp.]RWN27585.1 MAG: hypothetical protein EOR95_24300 [Mesorhizobium sp.]